MCFKLKLLVGFLPFLFSSPLVGQNLTEQEQNLLKDWNNRVRNETGQGRFRFDEDKNLIFEGGIEPHWAVDAYLRKLGMDPAHGTGELNLFKMYSHVEFQDTDLYRYLLGYLGRRDEWDRRVGRDKKVSGASLVVGLKRQLGADIFKTMVETRQRLADEGQFWASLVNERIPALTKALLDPKVLGLVTCFVLIAIALPTVVFQGSKAFFAWVFVKRPTILGPEDSDIYGSFFHRLLFRFPSVPKVIVNPPLQALLSRLVTTNQAITERNKGSLWAKPALTPYPHILAYGAPGTGKTLFAKNLAKKSGMHFMYMTVSSLSQLKEEEALTELKAFFDYAKKHGPTILIVDEADRLFAGQDVKAKKLALLFQQEFSKAVHTKIQLFFISNHPNQFPLPILNRISKLIEFDLPDHDTQLKLFRLHLERAMKLQKKSMKGLEGLNYFLSEELLEGLVGRDIEAIALSFSLLTQTSRESLLEEIRAYKAAKAKMKKFSMEETTKIVVDPPKETKKSPFAWLSY